MSVAAGPSSGSADGSSGRAAPKASAHHDPSGAGPRAHPARRRGWWYRFLLWTLALSIPAWWLADAYHLALRSAAALVLGVKLSPAPPGEVEVHATQVLAAYAAMCLASVGASRARRLAAVAVGLPLLFGIELLTGFVAMRTDALAAAGAVPAPVLRLRDEYLLAPPWLGAPLLWLLLLGRWELRDFGRQLAAKDARARTG